MMLMPGVLIWRGGLERTQRVREREIEVSDGEEGGEEERRMGKESRSEEVGEREGERERGRWTEGGDNGQAAPPCSSCHTQPLLVPPPEIQQQQQQQH